MLKNKLIGTGVALVTPFQTDGSVDFQALKHIVNHVVEGGVQYVVTLGTTSETPTLHAFERMQVIKTVVEEVRERVPVIVGMGGNCTAECVEMLKTTDFTGISGILSVVPYYNKPTQEGIFQHFTAISEASPVPIILYNIPSRCGVNMHVDTTLRLANAHSNIVAIKEASGDLAQIKTIIQQKPQDFRVISGDDALAVSVTEMGGSGVISVLANALPAQVSAMVKESLAQHGEKAHKFHDELQELIKLLFAEGNPCGIKVMMHILGFCENRLRLPLVHCSYELQTQIQRALQPFLKK